MAVVVAAVMRPAAFPFVPVGKGAVAASIHGETGAVYPDHPGKCKRVGDETFECTAYIPEDSTGIRTEYSVTADWTGCWSATPTRAPEAPDLASCISILDY